MPGEHIHNDGSANATHQGPLGRKELEQHQGSGSGVANKMIKGSPGASMPRTLDISEGGVYTHTAAAESRLTWELIVGWSEVESVFTLFPSPISFIPVPKRAMTPDQQNELRTLLLRKFPKRR
jgi:hypothetical protein